MYTKLQVVKYMTMTMQCRMLSIKLDMRGENILLPGLHSFLLVLKSLLLLEECCQILTSPVGVSFFMTALKFYQFLVLVKL